MEKSVCGGKYALLSSLQSLSVSQRVGLGQAKRLDEEAGAQDASDTARRVALFISTDANVYRVSRAERAAPGSPHPFPFLVAPCLATSFISYSTRSSFRLRLPALADSRPASPPERQTTSQHHRASTRASQIFQRSVRVKRACCECMRRTSMQARACRRHHPAQIPPQETTGPCGAPSPPAPCPYTGHARATQHSRTATARPQEREQVRTTRMPNVSFDTSKTPS